MFRWLDGSDARANGRTGLELAISKELVEHTSGGIGYKPAQGRGALFSFGLPHTSG